MFYFGELPKFDVIGDDGEDLELRAAALDRKDPDEWCDVYCVQYYADLHNDTVTDSFMLIL